MRISPINYCQYRNTRGGNIAFNGFFRDLKNLAGSAIDTGVKVVTGQTTNPEKEFLDQLSIRETGYRIGEKEKLEREIAENERRIREERANAERIEKERKELEQERHLRNLLQPHIKTLENEFFSMIEFSQKDPTILPPNGILIETPEPFNLVPPRLSEPGYFHHNPIMMAFRYCVENNYPITEDNLTKQLQKFEEEQDRERHKIIEYEEKCQKYNDRIQTQELIEQYLKNKQNINKFLITSLNSVEHLGSALSCAQNEYLKNGKHSLIFLDGFENIGKETSENKKSIAGLKSLMCSCAEKYHATLLLKIAADKLKSIDPILLVDSRVPLKIKL